jgi:hypothetical protein
MRNFPCFPICEKALRWDSPSPPPESTPGDPACSHHNQSIASVHRPQIGQCHRESTCACSGPNTSLTMYYLGVQRCDPQARARRGSTVAQHTTRQPLRQPGCMWDGWTVCYMGEGDHSAFASVRCSGCSCRCARASVWDRPVSADLTE